ncbi:MAG: MFS transporter [Deltaproteobacteria bacterium]|nr:MAG: MFS transporter [Deltaproteobacteria bacterium]
MFFLTSSYLIKFSTDVLGITPAAMGAIFLASRIWDAMSDPLAGYLSDRTRTRIGRRRPWMLAGAVPVGAVFALMWSPPETLTPQALVLWTGIMVVLFYTGMTVFMMPHDSLGAELSTGYHDRNRLFGVRRACFGIGAISALAALAWLSSAADARGDARAIAGGAAVITSLLMIFTAWRIRERPEYQGRGARNPLGAVSDIWRNPHARLLLLVFFLQQIGVGAVTIMAAYFSQYVLGAPGAVAWILGTFFVTSLVAIPLWVRLGQRFEKKSLCLVSMCVVSLAMGALGFMGEGDLVGVTLVAGLAGGAGACLDVLFPSIQADVIDYDELRTGERKEGMYFAAWSFAFKTASGLAGMLVGFLLGASGFEPNVEQTQSTKWAIRALMSGIPFFCYSAGLLVFMRFGLSRSLHAEIRSAIDARVS